VQSGRKILRRFMDYLDTNFTEFAMLIFIALYWTWSVRSPLNIGFRHLFPTLPFLYILTASGFKQWVKHIEIPEKASLFRIAAVWIRGAFLFSFRYFFLFVLLLWFLGETLYASPHFLSYFNQFGGGIFGGYRYVTDSNYDWGQDLLRLKKWVEERNRDSNPANDIDRIAVDYFGAGNPKYYLGDCEKLPVGPCAENWWSGRGDPREKGIRYLAVSVNTLQGAMGSLVPGQRRNPEDEYRWLRALRPTRPGFGNVPEPDWRAGTSIFIYKL